MKIKEFLRILSVAGQKPGMDSENNEARKHQIKVLENAISKIGQFDLRRQDKETPSHLEAFIIAGQYALAEQFTEKIFTLIYPISIITIFIYLISLSSIPI